MKRVIAAIMILVMALSMSGCKISYWGGLSKSEAKELVLNMLEEKYGEEFVVKRLYTGGSTGWNVSANLRGYFSSKFNENTVFQVEIIALGKEDNHQRILSDTYIQSIVGKEMKTKAELILSKHFYNFAVEVRVSGLSGLSEYYESGIYSAEKATIENYTNALPENNASTIWIAFDKNEFNSDYGRVADYVKEIVDEYYLTNGVFKCYFVSSEIVDKCKKKISDNHIDYNFDLTGDMEVTLSSHSPLYIYHFKGNDDEIYQTVFE